MIKLRCPDIIENTDIVLENIYSSDMEKVTKIAKLLRSALRTRELIKNEC